MRQDKLDRLDRAAELRLAIWTWLRDHPASLMSEIMLQFAPHPGETIRKAVHKMRSDLNCMMVGRRGHQGRYRATHLPPRTAADSRKRLRTCAPEDCRARAQSAAQASKAAREHKRPAPARPDEPWRTVHIGGREQAMKDQRGQGAVAPRASIRVGHY